MYIKPYEHKEWVAEGETPDGCRDPDCPCQ